MYNDYFKFTEKPFSIAPDPHFIFMSKRHQEGLAHLLYGINHGGGFVALTGEVGTGKTTLCHCLLQQLPENLDLALILNPKLNALELLATICDELRITYDKYDKTLKNLVDALNSYLINAHADARKTVLIIDEAQNLSLEVLEQIRLLTNLETSKEKLLQIILVGQPELNELLARRDLRQLNQRITARYHLLPLSLDETRLYIHHRLTMAKGDPDLFNENTIKEVFKQSQGVPRVINIICHCALLGAYASGTNRITSAMIKRATKETLGQTSHPPLTKQPLLLLMLMCGLTGWLYYQEMAVKPKPYAASLSTPTPNLHVPDLTLEQASGATGISPKIPGSAATPQQPEFSVWLNNPKFTLSESIRNTLKYWGKAELTDGQFDCARVQEVGLACLFDRGNWKDLMLFNRPTVMEFSIAPDIKRYALLTGIKNGQPVLYFEHDFMFPLADVLRFWDGYYLLLWKPPKPELKLLAPGQTSPNVEWLRAQLNKIDHSNSLVRNPKHFDAALKSRVINFQKSKQLTADGKVGMQTLFHLDSASGAEDSPHLRIE